MVFAGLLHGSPSHFCSFGNQSIKFEDHDPIVDESHIYWGRPFGCHFRWPMRSGVHKTYIRLNFRVLCWWQWGKKVTDGLFFPPSGDHRCVSGGPDHSVNPK